MLIEHNRTAHRRTFELPCGKVVELWRDQEFIGMSRLLGVDIQVFETREDWENFRGSGNFDYPENGIKQRYRSYWLEAERNQSKEKLAVAENQIAYHRQFLKTLLKMDDVGGRDDLNYFIAQHLAGRDPFTDSGDEEEYGDVALGVKKDED